MALEKLGTLPDLPLDRLNNMGSVPSFLLVSSDWETINKLCEQNGDFAKFVEDVKIDFESKRIHKSEYDEIPKDSEKYIVEKLGVEQSG